MFQAIGVFCGSSSGKNPVYAQAARELGQLFAARKIQLVYGAGSTGIMGALADAVLANQGRALGVIPEALATKELMHTGLSELRIVNSMHERKALMAEHAAAFIALPGGFGTLDEFCEIITWAQLGFHRKPCGVLNVNGYFDGLLELFDHAVSEGFVRAEHRALIVSDTNAVPLLEKMQQRVLKV